MRMIKTLQVYAQKSVILKRSKAEKRDNISALQS